MKAIPFRIVATENSSIHVQRDRGAQFYKSLHYHPEYQLTKILKGRGMLYVANGFVPFEPGDVFIIGSNIPHLMRAEENISGPPNVDAISLFFGPLSFGHQFFNIPELLEVNELLQKSKKGIKFKRPNSNEIGQIIEKAFELRNFELLISLFQALNKMLFATPFEFISRDAALLPLNEIHGERLNAIFQFTLSHLTNKITIPEIAKVANLSASQFSRYFKRHTRKTYIQFLNELRIEKACGLLKSTDLTIENIAYDVGFQNMTNFNRQFKKSKATTPNQFRKKSRPINNEPV